MRKDNIRGFRGLKGLKTMPYNKQGLIYFTCMDVKNQPLEVQRKILNLCTEIAGNDYKALYDVLTVNYKTVDCIAREHFLSEKKLYSLRKKFFENW